MRMYQSEQQNGASMSCHDLSCDGTLQHISRWYPAGFYGLPSLVSYELLSVLPAKCHFWDDFCSERTPGESRPKGGRRFFS